VSATKRRLAPLAAPLGGPPSRGENPTRSGVVTPEPSAEADQSSLGQFTHTANSRTTLLKQG
jgi:hypothetical protein